MGDDRTAYINLFVPKGIIPQLVGRYSDGFERGVRACRELLVSPLFGSDDRLEFAAHIGGGAPLKCQVQGVSFPEAADVLCDALREFVKSFARGPLRPTETRQASGCFCWASIDYRRVSSTQYTQIELRLMVPATATRRRFEAFRDKAVNSGVRQTQEAGKVYLSCDEVSDTFGYGHFAVYGNVFGEISLSDIRQEVAQLFNFAAADLSFPD